MVKHSDEKTQNDYTGLISILYSFILLIVNVHLMSYQNERSFDFWPNT